MAKIITKTTVFLFIISLVYIYQNFFLDLFVKLQHTYFSVADPYKGGFGSLVETKHFNSISLNNYVSEYKVYLPKDYFKNEQLRFPTLYLLHGFPGDDKDFLVDGSIQETLDQMINNGDIKPFIVVFPNGNGKYVRDSQYLNADKVDQNMEDNIIELVGEVDKEYRTINEPFDRGLGGISAGGYGAFNIGLHHNDKFGIIMSQSGYFINMERSTFELLKNPDPFNNPLSYIKSANISKDTKFYMDIGRDDNKRFVEENRQMAEFLKQNNYSVSYTETEGSHDWGVWRKNLKNSIKFFGDNFKQNF